MADTNLSTPLSPRATRKPAASPLWLVGVAGACASLGLVAALANVTPFYNWGARLNGAWGGYGGEFAAGLPVFAVVLGVVWWFVLRERPRERITGYAVGAVVAWLAGMGAGAWLTANLDDAGRTGAPPNGGAVEQRYWQARVADVNSYYVAAARLSERGHLRAPSNQAQLADAHAAIAELRRALATARARNTGDIDQRREDLASLGQNEFERRALLVDFNDSANAAEDLIRQLWDLEARHLDALDNELTQLEQMRGRWRAGPSGILFLSSADLERYRPTMQRVYQAEHSIWDITFQLNQLLQRVIDHPVGGSRRWIGFDTNTGSSS